MCATPLVGLRRIRRWSDAAAATASIAHVDRIARVQAMPPARRVDGASDARRRPSTAPTSLRNFAQSGLCGAEKRPCRTKRFRLPFIAERCARGCQRRRCRWRAMPAGVSRVKHETAEKKMFCFDGTGACAQHAMARERDGVRRRRGEAARRDARARIWRRGVLTVEKTVIRFRPKCRHCRSE